MGTRPIAVGEWHSVHLLTLADGQRRILRSRVSDDWLRTDPEYTTEREAAVLQLLERAGIDAPRVIAVGTSALLLSWIPGASPGAWVEGDGALAQLAEALARIHQVDPSGVPPYQRYYPPGQLVRPGGIGDGPLWDELVAVVASVEPRAETRLIHRDYHAANTVWSRRRLAGVVDWTQASAGPPEVDVGHMRFNLAGAFGVEVADRFLDQYEWRAGRHRDQAYWDLVTLADVGSARFEAGFRARLEPYLRCLLKRV